LSDNHRSYCAVPGALSAADDAALSSYAELFSLALRTTYARQERAIRSGTPLTTLEQKQYAQNKFDLTSRQASAVRVEADGKRAAQGELDWGALKDVTNSLRNKERTLKADQKKLGLHKKGDTFKLKSEAAKKLKAKVYRAQTTCQKLRARKEQLTNKVNTGRTSLTFGTRKLLRQHPVYPDMAGMPAAEAKAAETQYWEELADWTAQWESSRANQFYVLGSKDETGGCQGCVATVQENGLFTLRVRLPNAIKTADGSVYVTLTDVRVPYGAKHLLHALAQQEVRSTSLAGVNLKLKDKNKSLEDGAEPLKLKQTDVQGGAAITWRFIREDSGWKMWFSTDVFVPQVTTSAHQGMLGLDTNAGFISLAVVDRFGSIRKVWNIKTPSRGFTAEQRSALLAEAVKKVIVYCKKAGIPLALEDLDLSKKKKELGALGVKSKRKLMAMAYAELRGLLLARASDAGVEVIFVPPAYTSTQGLVRYSIPRGWSAHCGAAGVIARRALGLYEKAPVRGTILVPLVGTAVEWTVPVETLRSDVSRRWPLLHRDLKKTIASYFRKQRAAASPLPDKLPALCALGVVGETPTRKRALRPPAKG
jgi:IS605 OrfB family transposase